MLNYLLGFTHACIIACLLILYHPTMRQDRSLAQVPAPYTLVIQDDCYLPSEDGAPLEVLRLSVDMLEHHNEGLAP